jgi:hypothetical protein
MIVVHPKTWTVCLEVHTDEKREYLLTNLDQESQRWRKAPQRKADAIIGLIQCSQAKWYNGRYRVVLLSQTTKVEGCKAGILRQNNNGRDAGVCMKAE